MRTIILLKAILLCTVTVFAQVDPVDKNGLAIGGYDVVNYFTTSTAVKGNPEYVSQHNNVFYNFLTKENQMAFEANPSRYLPEFDGYCALAVSYGKKISINPQRFKITNDKLYLFFDGKTSRGQVNSLTVWNKNEERLLKKANGLWPDVKKTGYKSKDTL